MSLIHNERTKLLANSLDRASTGCVVAGLITPAASLAKIDIQPTGLTASTMAGTIIWLFAAVVLHWIARRILGGLI